MPDAPLPRSAQVLGYSGLIPQIGFLATAALAPPLAPAAAILGWAYAGLIFSFLGGAWWGFALLDHKAPRWVLPVSVMPSLIALLSVVPTVLALPGFTIPLVMIGAGLLVSPLVDTAISRSANLPEGWLRLRWHLSLGLGGLTLFLAIFSGQ